MALTGKAKAIADRIAKADTFESLMAIEQSHSPDAVSAEDGVTLSRLFGARAAELRGTGRAKLSLSDEGLQRNNAAALRAPSYKPSSER